MTPSEYIQKAQDLLEFHLKVGRFYVELWNEFPWLVNNGVNLPPLNITIDIPLGQNDYNGGFGFDESVFDLFYTGTDVLTFNEVKQKIFAPFIDCIVASGMKYHSVIAKESKGFNAVIDATQFTDLSKGFKNNLRGLCTAFDDAVMKELNEEATNA